MPLLALHSLTLLGLPFRLTPGDLLEIEESGPYTRDPLRVLLILNPERVKRKLQDWLTQSLGFVKQAIRRNRLTDPRQLSLALIARSQAGRPNVACGGRTSFDLLKPMLDTDTKSHEDALKINDYSIKNCKPGDPAAEQLAQGLPGLPRALSDRMWLRLAAKMKCRARILRGDGQSVVTMANEKKENPEVLGDVVIANGGFHTSGHFAFAGNEGFHDCKFGRSKDILGFEKVPKHIPNFENDSYKHSLNFLRIDYIGTLAYFLLDVESPIPELLLDDPEQYLSLINVGGGVAAFESMRYVGAPISQYILAARSADGEKNCDLEAYAFHCMRAYAHKPVEARVLLISLLGSQTTHPKIAQIVKETAFFSWLGLDGHTQFADRAMERVNLVQDERRGKFSAFEHALEFTPHLEGLLHCLAALDAANDGPSKSSDPLTEGMVNGARAVREDLKARLGTDLTRHDPTNALYHTGGAPNMVNATNRQSHKPWEFIWRVADKTSTGPGRSDPEAWDEYAKRFISDRLWTCHAT